MPVRYSATWPDVIKIESPEGAPIRGISTHRGVGMGAIFHNIDQSKRRIALDLKKSDGHAVMIDLIKGADSLLCNRRRQAMKRLSR